MNYELEILKIMEEIKRKVALSGWAKGMTAVNLVLIVAMYFYFSYRLDAFFMWFYMVCMVAWLFASLMYMPLSISVNDSELTIRRPLRSKRIPLNAIESVDPTPATMGERRIIGSGGFLGYWGWFSNRVEGKYFAYYGKSSDCFFVRLRSGRGYLLGCTGSDAIVDFIKPRLSRRPPVE